MVYKMVRIVILIVFLISGCSTVTSEFYSPVVKNSERLSIGSCGHRFESFVRKLDEGVYLEIFNQQIIFRMKKENSIKFIDTIVAFTSSDLKEVKNVEIAEITTGIFLTEYETKTYDLESMKFMPADEFMSVGQYEGIDMAWGEWSPWKSNEDVFRVNLKEYLQFEPGSSFVIKLPSFYLNGQETKVEPIKFVWKKKSALMCFQ